MKEYFNEEQKAEFKKAVRPVMEWLRNNADPHHTITIGYGYATLSEETYGVPHDKCEPEE